jgi:hypothetical protein
MLVKEKNASLSTLSVTIQALHVQGKQMTLAVFRQLPTMVVDKNCSIWGIVRYEIKDLGNLWLVFSFNNCLYKMKINLNSYTRAIKEKIESKKTKLDYTITLRFNPDVPETNEEILKKEILELENNLNEEKQRLELHQYYANNYPQLFIAV